MQSNPPAAKAIVCEKVSRTFKLPKKGSVEALRDVDLEIASGELFGLLGPNGAGKTTLIKILCTLLLPSSGRALVDGVDVATDAQRLRPLISMVSGGESSGFGLLTVREQLFMFSQFYGVPPAEARRRLGELLDVTGLVEAADRRVSSLSTGMRQKMNLCRGLLSEPRVLFLDEPTLGLDVGISITIRAYVKKWLREREGRTILLTTHYMLEAEEMCNRIAVIDRGGIIALDTPRGLKRRIQPGSVFVIATEPPPDAAELGRLPGVLASVSQENGTLRLTLTDDAALPGVLPRITDNGRRLLTLEKVEPSLEEAFVRIVSEAPAGPTVTK